MKRGRKPKNPGSEVAKRRHVCECRYSEVIKGMCVSHGGIAPITDSAVETLEVEANKWVKRISDLHPTDLQSIGQALSPFQLLRAEQIVKNLQWKKGFKAQIAEDSTSKQTDSLVGAAVTYTEANAADDSSVDRFVGPSDFSFPESIWQNSKLQAISNDPKAFPEMFSREALLLRVQSSLDERLNRVGRVESANPHSFPSFIQKNNQSSIQQFAIWAGFSVNGETSEGNNHGKPLSALAIRVIAKLCDEWIDQIASGARKHAFPQRFSSVQQPKPLDSTHIISYIQSLGPLWTSPPLFSP